MFKTPCLLLLCLFLRHGDSTSPEPIMVNLNTRRATHVLNEHFVSMTINPTDLLQGRPFGMGSNNTLNILKGLAPAYVRLGGPDTNRYIFRNQNNGDDLAHSADEYSISEEYWKGLNDFLRRSGLDVIVCLNSQHRTGQGGKWDPRNALELITYSDRQQYNITWELGYEPTRAEDISGTQFGKEIIQLRSILNAFPRYRDAKVIGPDVRSLHHKEDVDHALDVLIEAGPAINAVTWHPRWPHVSSIVSSDSSDESYDFPPDYIEWDRNQLHKLLQKAVLKKPFWISEPKAENTGSFAEGLIFARRLALAAKLGIEVVMKQPSLKDIAHPKPEYWVALLHKKTLGRTLLDSRPMTNQSDISLVVQCTSKTYGHDKDGGLTVMAINTASIEQRAIVRGLPPGHIGEPVHQYILSAGKEKDAIFSQMAYLNGEPLLMGDDGKLPNISPKTRHLGQNLLVKLPPYSVGFWVMPHLKVKICEQEPESLIPLNLNDLGPAQVAKAAQEGIKSLRDMNHIIVNKLLNPTMSVEEENNEEEQSSDSVEDEEGKANLKRKNRQTVLDDLGMELRKRVEELKEIMNLNLKGWKDEERTESSENHLRVAENKIDSIAEDLNKVINGESQEKEFGRFLEVSGLKSDFGKMMMDDRLNDGKGKTSLDDEFELDDSQEKGLREKRELKLSNQKQYAMIKDGHLNLDEIEKNYKKIIAKHKKAIDPKKFTNIELGKINKELHEDLLLKEITLLEKTEETLAEVMRNHQERVDAVEEMLHEELEEMKGEKLMALMEIKTEISHPKTDKGKILKHPNSLLQESLKDGMKLAPKKRETDTKEGEKDAETPKTEDAKKDDPIVAIRNYFIKRQEELAKRIARNKLLLEASKGKESTQSMTTEPPATSGTTETPATTTTEEALEIPIIEQLKDGEKRRTDVLKYMTDYIDQINSEAKEEHSDESGGDEDIFSKRKPRTIEDKKLNPASVIMGKIINTMKEVHENYNTFQDTKKGNPEISDTEEPTYEVTPNDSGPMEPEVKEEEFQAKKESQKEPTKKTMGFQKEENTESDPKSAPDNETTVSNTETARKKRDLATENPSKAAMEIDQKAKARNQAIFTNTIVKRKIPADDYQIRPTEAPTELKNSAVSAEDEELKPKAMLDLAGSTVKAVFDKVIPSAYGQAKKKLDSLGLPEYLKKLGKVVENFEDLDKLFKDVRVLNNVETDTSEHIQRIDRAKRGVSEQPEMIGPFPTDNEISEMKKETTEVQPESRFPEEQNINKAAEWSIPEEQNIDTIADLGIPEDQNIETTTKSVIPEENIETTTKSVIPEENIETTTKLVIPEEQNIDTTTKSTSDITHGSSTTEVPIEDTTMSDDEMAELIASDIAIEEVLDNLAEKIIREETIQRLEQTKNETIEKPDDEIENSSEQPIQKIKKHKNNKTQNNKEVDDDGPLSQRLLADEAIVTQIIENFLRENLERSANRNKGKRAIPHFGNAAKMEALYPYQQQQQQLSEEPVSQFLRQLQPGVYVVPSKDMANVHAEQTALAAATGNDGKPKPNVVTLNIFYDKKEDDKQQQDGTIAENQAGINQQYYRPQWPGNTYKQPQPAVVPAPAVPTFPVPAPAVPTFPNLRKLYDPRYNIQAIPPRQYPAFRAPQLTPQYNDGYSIIRQNTKPQEEFIYEEPNPLKQSSPKLIPVSPFSTWMKSKAEQIQQPTWQPVKEPEDELQTNTEATTEVQDEVKPWYLRKSMDESPTYAKKDTSNGNKKEFTNLERMKTIEPYWNRTLKEIFQETSKDPFWDFIDSKPENASQTNFESVPDANLVENQQTSRKKRSIDYSTGNELNGFDTKSFDNAWSKSLNNPYDYYIERNLLQYDEPVVGKFRDRRSMLNNLLVKEKAQAKYPLETDRVIHKIFPRKQFKTSDLGFPQDPAADISGFQVISSQMPIDPQFEPYTVPYTSISSTTPDNISPSLPTFPIEKIYEIAIDLLRRFSSV